MSEPPEAGASPLVWTEDGRPRSRLYDDVYFSAVDGLAETRAVFLQGCGLPDAWKGRSRFTVGELGFGTGLNILALIELWRRERPAGARLHVFSIEAHPLQAAEAARALAAWPELADLAGALTERWPGRAPGFHRLAFEEADVILDLAVMEAGEALRQWRGRADAWFLDGFSPALNPAMWRQEVLDLVAARSAPGARAATFTVAGAVRRGLAEAGFTVEKQPGFGRKRERLEARLPGEPAAAGAGRVAVIGAGVAGCATVRAARALGAQADLFDIERLGAGASGNPAALVTPRLDAGGGPIARLFAQALERANQIYAATPRAVIARGVVQAPASERDGPRFARVADGNAFEAGDLRLIDAAEAAERLAEPDAPGGLMMETALVIEPAVALQAWAGTPGIARVAAVEPDAGGGWRLLDAAGGFVGLADAVIVCAGHRSADLVAGLPLQPVRGQVSWRRGAEPPAASAWGGYVAPMRDGFVFGATHDRDEAGEDVREQDHLRNLKTLAAGRPRLAGATEGQALEGRASVRATSPDHLPLAGAAPGAGGLFVLTALGGRGFATAPLLAEHVAALALEAPSPLPAALAELVDPARFGRRAARRGRS
ncbi:tRNA (5-methylaminomethyl-2-thiouridine)(34)-methyltransferase MnmD [Phenylobacterium sp.]|uniref:tRNA (5-methylaminomethyl-2-thiouridine)(34)-methyltransferase MnmD n=1 Tax=Phenylobacterium sp. TaxID=1871053 RepID=UPI0035AE6B49